MNELEHIHNGWSARWLAHQMEKRPAEVAEQTIRMRVPTRTEILYAPTRQKALKALKRGQRRGEFAAAYDLTHYVNDTGRGWAVKVVRIKPAPQPFPMWARVCVRIGLVLIGLSLAVTVLLAAASALIGSLVALPWMAIVGTLIVVAFLLLVATGSSRKCCEVMVRVWH